MFASLYTNLICHRLSYSGLFFLRATTLSVFFFISSTGRGMKTVCLSFQVRKTATRLWSENVVLDTSQTFGVTHESRFFDWGEQLIFTLDDMDRIVRHNCFLPSSHSSFPSQHPSCPRCFYLCLPGARILLSVVVSVPVLLPTHRSSPRFVLPTSSCSSSLCTHIIALLLLVFSLKQLCSMPGQRRGK